jgi:hypothetical protein
MQLQRIELIRPKFLSSNALRGTWLKYAGSALIVVPIAQHDLIQRLRGYVLVVRHRPRRAGDRRRTPVACTGGRRGNEHLTVVWFADEHGHGSLLVSDT